MHNVKIEKGSHPGEIVLRVSATKGEIAKAPLSSTGRTLLLASTSGAVPVTLPGVPDGVTIALNVMVKPGKAAAAA